MSTFFPVIEELDKLQSIHNNYVKEVLKILKNKINQLEEIEIGVIKADDGTLLSSLITVTDGDNENIFFSIEFEGEYFFVDIHPEAEESYFSEFRIEFDDFEIDNYLNKEITNKMKEVFETRKPFSLKLKK